MGDTTKTLTENSPRFTQKQEKLTCEICIEPISNRFENNGDKCSHPYCNDCMIKYIQVKLYDDNVGHIKCPAVDCECELDPFACAPVIGAPLFVRWCDVLCEAALVMDMCCFCPYQNCNVLIANECGENPTKSNCPSCKRLFCFKCKKVWHAGFRCGESTRDPNDVALGRLAEQSRWMRCPRCRHFVERTAGCLYIKCRCGIKFCYKCGKQVQNSWCDCPKPSACAYVCSCFCLLFLLLIFVTVFMLPWIL